MKTLLVVLLLIIDVELASTQVPQNVKEEMRLEEPEYRESKPISALVEAVVLYFPKAKLWVVTTIRMVGPNHWIFKDKDIELIVREVKGKLITLYEKREEA
ncbi:MAG: hypothetical protein Q7K26_00830 [bacterium]|nr:hypothetical protein [bacterium]